MNPAKILFEIRSIIFCNPKYAKPLLKDATPYSSFSCNSDHRPVTAKLRMQLYRMKTVKPATRQLWTSNVCKMKNPGKATMNTFMRNSWKSMQRLTSAMTQTSALRYFCKESTKQPLKYCRRFREDMYSCTPPRYSRYPKNRNSSELTSKMSQTLKSLKCSGKKRNELLHTLRTKVEEEQNHQIRDWHSDLQEWNNEQKSTSEACVWPTDLANFNNNRSWKRNHLKN